MKKTTGLGIVFFVFWLLVSVVSAQDARQQALMDAIKANPNDPVAHFNLGVSYFNGQKFNLAIPEFQKCLQINSGDKQSKEMLESCEGISSYFQQNYSAAVEHLQNTLKINPQNPNAYPYLADSYMKLKQFANAEETLKSYSKTSPRGKEKAGEVLSKIYMDQKRYSEAVTELKDLIAADPKNFEAYEDLGGCFFEMKDYKNAAQYLEGASRIRKDAQTYKFLGTSFYNLGDFNNAIDNYKKSIQIETAKDPKEQNVESLDYTYYNLAVAYADNGLNDKAAEAFAAAFKIDPKDSNAAVGQAQAIEAATNAHMEKASSYLLNNQYSDAISEWQMVLKYQPDNKQAQDFIMDAKAKLSVEVEKHYSSGKVYSQKGNTLQALNEWNLGLQMDPQNEKIQKAIKTIKVNTNARITALLSEGDNFYQSRDYSDAFDSYLKASKIDPHNSKVKKRLKQLKSKQTDEIDAVYVKALKLGSKGDLKGAQKYLLIAKQIDSSNSKIGNALFKIQKDITVKIKELDAEGVSLFESGNKDKAQTDFQEVLKLKPNDETANEYITKLTGQQSHEKADAEQVKALYYEGVNLYINGKINEAIDKWKDCLKQDPGNLNAQNNIKKAEAKLNSIAQLSHN